MQSAERLTRQIAFLIECDRLKDIVRQTLNAHSGRPENDAEHSWALCLFVMTLAEHSNTPIDVLRVMKMLLIHDIVEIDAGDTFCLRQRASRRSTRTRSDGGDPFVRFTPR